MDGEQVQSSPHDLDVRPKHSTLCNPQQVISCSGGPLDTAIHNSGDIYVASEDNSIHVFDQGGHEKRTIDSGGSGDQVSIWYIHQRRCDACLLIKAIIAFRS